MFLVFFQKKSEFKILFLMCSTINVYISKLLINYSWLVEVDVALFQKKEIKNIIN
jgi:hypothetical protein